MASRLSLFLTELKRRKVTRVAVVYAVVGIGVVEAAQLLFEAFELPHAAFQVVTFLVILGLPVALVLAWALEITPAGLQRTADLSPDELAARAPERWSPSSWVLVVVGFGAVLGAGYFLFSRNQGPSLAADLVAVDLFDNQTGDPALDPLGKMIAEEVTQGLTRIGLVRVVHIELVLQHARAAPGGEGGGPSSSRSMALARETRAGLLVTGSYYQQGDSIRLQGSLVEASSGEILASLPPSVGSRENPGPAVSELSQRTMAAVAQRFNQRLGDLIDVVPPPRSFAAYEAYSAGMDAFLDQDMRRSIQHFRRALEEDPDYADALLYLAVAHRNVGEDEESDSILSLVEREPGGLTPLQRVFAELQRAWADGDREGAYLAAKKGAGLAVSGNWGYQVGSEALRMNRPEEALEVLSELDPEAPEMAGWTTYWTRLGDALHRLGRYEEALAQVERGLALHRANLSLLQVRLENLAALGRLEEMRALLDGLGAYAWQRQAGGRHVAGLELRAHGFEEEGKAYLEESLTFFKDRPQDVQESESFRSLHARYLYHAEHWEESRALYAALAEEDSLNLVYLGQLGVLAARAGERDLALEYEVRLKEAGRADVGGLAANWRGCIHALLGEKEEAVRLLQESFEKGSAFSSFLLHLDPDLEPLRGYPPFEEFIRPKG